jgi:hypothetical protein
MKMYPVPKQGLAGPLNNFGRPSSTIYGSLYREAFGINTLRFASHQESLESKELAVDIYYFMHYKQTNYDSVAASSETKKRRKLERRKGFYM